MTRLFISLLACAMLALGLNAQVVAGPPCAFVRGNIVNDASAVRVDLNDGVDLISFLFEGKFVSELTCVDAGDINDDGLVTMADYTYLIEFLFNDGPPPPPPFPDPGPDPTPGVSVANLADPRFSFSIGSGSGVPNNTGIALPITMTNDAEITGLTLVFEYDPFSLRVDEIITEENTVLSGVSADYIIASFDNVAGIGFIGSLRDFSTPFYFISGEDNALPTGTDQLVATLKVAVVNGANQGFSAVEFVDGLKVPNNRVVAPPAELLPEAHNLVFDLTTAIRPTLNSGGGVSVRRGFIRGDANGDTVFDIADPITVLNYLFAGGEKPPCLDAVDANNDTKINLADALWLLNFMFRGGPQPSEPFPQPGIDPSDDGSGSLGCASDGD